jgi:predicted HTH transcriptional regulator
LVAFLNTQGGIIYIGVEDDGKPVGVDKLDETLKDIADIITTQILPNPQEYVELGTTFIDGKHIIEIKVNKSKALYYIKKYGRSANGCFIRMGTSNRSMTEEQIEKGLIDTLDRQERSLRGRAHRYLRLKNCFFIRDLYHLEGAAITVRLVISCG